MWKDTVSPRGSLFKITQGWAGNRNEGMKGAKSVLQVNVKCYFSGGCYFKHVSFYAFFRNDRFFFAQNSRVSGQRCAAPSGAWSGQSSSGSSSHRGRARLSSCAAREAGGSGPGLARVRCQGRAALETARGWRAQARWRAAVHCGMGDRRAGTAGISGHRAEARRARRGAGGRQRQRHERGSGAADAGGSGQSDPQAAAHREAAEQASVSLPARHHH